MTGMSERLRRLTSKEREELEKLARSKKPPQARSAYRGNIILGLEEPDGDERVSVTALAEDLDVSRPTIYKWARRFMWLGFPGLKDKHRSGRPPTYSPAEIATVIQVALTPPPRLGLPFKQWTLDRLEEYLNEQENIKIKRMRISQLLKQGGIVTAKQNVTFGNGKFCCWLIA